MAKTPLLQLERIATWRKDNKQHVDEYRRQWRHRKLVEFKAKVYETLGSKCACCGFTDIRILELDHINGGGTQHRKSIKEAYRYYQQILIDINNYQLLCPCCHKYKTKEITEWLYAI